MNQRLKYISVPAFILTLAYLFLPVAPALASNGPFFSGAGNIGSIDTSSNWAGYVETTGPFTGVSGSWTIPSAAAMGGTTESSDATWIGVGGVTSTDLIQTGTQAVTINGQTSYQAWYEMLPATSTAIPVTVNPGDSVSASLTETSQNGWSVSFRDNSNGQSYTTTFSYASSLSSAEWIEEMPSLANHTFIPLDNFGTANFQNAFSVRNGIQGNLVTNGAEPMTMINNSGQTLAAPSGIGADQASFSVTRNTATVASTTPNVQIRIVQGGQPGTHRAGVGAQGFQRIPRQQIQGAEPQQEGRTMLFQNNPFLRFQIRFGMRI